jgi:flagellar hook-associated protein 3 FlgL
MISNLNPSGEAFLANMTRVQRRVEEATRQASSGLRVNVASDAPDEVDAIMQLRTDTVRNTQLSSNLSLAKTDADAADSALTSATKLLDRARQLGAQGANFTLDASGRQSLAGEVEALQEQMVAISRTAVQGRYIFAGDDENTAPYQLDLTSPTGVQRMMTAPATRRLEDPAGGSFAVSKTAGEMFDARNPDGTPAPNNVFAALNSLRVALLNNDTAGITAATGNIQNASDQMGISQGFYGSVLGRIQDATNYGQSYDVQLKTQLSQKVDADITEAAMTLTQGTTQLQAAFQMQAKMPRTSLFDFIG